MWYQQIYRFFHIDKELRVPELPGWMPFYYYLMKIFYLLLTIELAFLCYMSGNGSDVGMLDVRVDKEIHYNMTDRKSPTKTGCRACEPFGFSADKKRPSFSDGLFYMCQINTNAGCPHWLRPSCPTHPRRRLSRYRRRRCNTRRGRRKCRGASTGGCRCHRR